jgi:hypothetical protein
MGELCVGCCVISAARRATATLGRRLRASNMVRVASSGDASTSVAERRRERLGRSGAVAVAPGPSEVASCPVVVPAERQHSSQPPYVRFGGSCVEQAKGLLLKMLASPAWAVHPENIAMHDEYRLYGMNVETCAGVVFLRCLHFQNGVPRLETSLPCLI